MRAARNHKVLRIVAGIALLLVTASVIGAVFIIHYIHSEMFPSGQGYIPPGILDSALSIDEINLVPPGDLLNEISYYGSGGGVPSDQQEVECPGSVAPTIKTIAQVEWLYPFYFYGGCGWVDGESVSVAIFMPDGKTKTDQLTAYNGFTYSYEMTTMMPPGEYIFEFSGASGRVEKHVEVFVPSTPHVYRLLSERKLVLYGFRPKEKVRIFIYYYHLDLHKEICTFVGWRRIAMDESGQAFIEIPDEEMLVYFVEGKKSGIVDQEGSSLPIPAFFKDNYPLPFLPEN